MGNKKNIGILKRKRNKKQKTKHNGKIQSDNMHDVLFATGKLPKEKTNAYVLCRNLPPE